MFKYIQFRNFSSAQDLIKLNFEVPKKYYKEQEGNHVATIQVCNGQTVRLYKQLVLFGLNASGKTNILSTIANINRFIVDSFKTQTPESKIKIWNPYRFIDNPNSTSSDYESVFYIENVQYQYKLSISNKYVINEELSYWPVGKITQLYKRTTTKEGHVVIIWGNKYSSPQQKNIEISTKSNVPLLTTAAFLNDEILLPIYLFFKKQRRTVSTIDRSEDNQGILNCETDLEYKKSLLSTLSQTDFFSITDINIVKQQLSDKDFPPELLKLLDKTEPLMVSSVFLVHDVKGKGYPLPFSKESSGTKAFSQLFYRFYFTLKKKGLDLIDEIEVSLHPALIKYILNYFNDKSKESQLIFTTHNISLLDDSENVKRGEIYFIGRNELGVTIAKRLSDYQNIRSNSKIEIMYSNGQFGAYPIVKYTSKNT